MTTRLIVFPAESELRLPEPLYAWSIITVADTPEAPYWVITAGSTTHPPAHLMAQMLRAAMRARRHARRRSQ